jgi:CrcB protein
VIHYHSLVAVAVGGALGSVCRWAALEIAGGDAAAIGTDATAQRALLTTLAINVLGSLLVGLLTAWRHSIDSTRLLATGTGFAGGFTTFSNFAVAVAQKLDDGELVSALSNGFGTALLAVLAAGIGYRLGMVTR